MNIKNYTYRLKAAAWEITLACNMHCKHCCPVSGEPSPDELSTAEALDLCDQLIDIGVKRVTLSGGEPFMREDWSLLANRLTEGKIAVNVISNGWFIDEKIIRTAFDVGLSNMAVSLDGSEETHDYIRVKGSFKRALRALDLMQKMRMPSVVCTCLTSCNIKDLPYLNKILIKKGVRRWLLQIIEPTGNALRHTNLLLTSDDLEQTVDFAHRVMEEGKILIDIADNIGYFDLKSSEIRSHTFEEIEIEEVWSGCQAGKSVIGIRCNGDITPCLSIRDDEFIEGNIRNSSLHKIWSRPGAFAWNRDMKQKNLTGFCQECQFGDICLGGCTTMKKATSKTLYENKHCLYRNEFINECKVIEGLGELNDLLSKGRELVKCCQYEAANKCLRKANELYPECPEVLDLLNYIKQQSE